MPITSNRLKEQINAVSVLFGGYYAIESIIPDNELLYLATFPGDIFVTSPWYFYNHPGHIDLISSGYIPDRPYKVFNKYHQHLYTAKANASFGENTDDINIIHNSYHGEYFHLEFYDNTLGRKRVFLLLVCKELPRQTTESFLDAYRRLRASKDSRTRPELYLNVLTVNLPITAYSLEARWDVNITPQAIINDPTSERTDLGSGSYAFMLLRPGYWYAIFDSNDNPLYINNLQGNDGRFLPLPSGTFHFLSSFIPLGRYTYSSLTTPATSNLGEIRLSADLVARPTTTGTSSFEATGSIGAITPESIELTIAPSSGATIWMMGVSFNFAELVAAMANAEATMSGEVYEHRTGTITADVSTSASTVSIEGIVS